MYDFHSVEDFFTDDRPKRKKFKYIMLFLIALAAFGFFLFTFLPPNNFPANTVITVEKGVSLTSIANNFKEKNIIKSPGVFKTFVIAFGGEHTISFGDYLFEKPLNSFEIAKRMAIGKFGVEKITVTLPEGLTNKEMAEILDSKLSYFDSEVFLYMTRNMEGYLFPDTYYFFSTVTAGDVLTMIQANFNKKVDAKILESVEKSGHSLSEILTMASIIQNEAYDGYVEKQTISGILWKRIKKNMRLQVDASLAYIVGKNSKDFSASLKEDNPYNTYTRYGLPPTPIGNPGLQAIKASANPVDSPYFFYLHDSGGTIHYASTYEEHKKNINLYLR